MRADPNDLNGKRILILGLGVNQGGVGAARYAHEMGAQVRVTDLQPTEKLASALMELEHLPITFTLGRHQSEDILWADIIVRNPGVPRESEWLELARENGARIEMEMTLFFRACPGITIGVTGTKGKSTTSTMLATLLGEFKDDTILAGNMGVSALAQLPLISRETLVVIELSSFQIEGLDEHRLGPDIAIITNIGEDHFDRYASFREYACVKAAIATHQSAGCWLIYDRDDPRVASLLAGSPAQTATFGTRPTTDENALWVDGERFSSRWRGQNIDLGSVDALRLRGEHVKRDALAAMCGALAAGASPDTIARAVPSIKPLEHRLEPVAVVNGVEYINDTTATVPAASIAALRAFEGKRLIVIAGGSDKRLDLRQFAADLSARAEGVVLLSGSATPRLEHLLVELGFSRIEGPFDSMTAAVERSSECAVPGSVVLLSPGCASFGMFQNEFHRGREFRIAVDQIGGNR